MPNQTHPTDSETSLSETTLVLPDDAVESVYSLRDLWYFKTREGDEIGPFRYRSEAESNLDRFMQQLKERL
jgi:hypothetical protein